MLRKWLVVLPLLVVFNQVILQPIQQGVITREPRQSDRRECCPCPDSERSSSRYTDNDRFADSSVSPTTSCPCDPRASDAEASASILLPALRAIQPFVSKPEEKGEQKPLLQPEVGLASSVLETLRKATDEEYQDALARDAARSAVKLIESDLSLLGDSLVETPKNVVRIFLNSDDDMDDNLPEPSHIQETRCIHPSLGNIQTMGKLRMSRPTPTVDILDSSRRSSKKVKGLLHKNQYDMDSRTGASNIQERILPPNTGGGLQEETLKLNNLKKGEDSRKDLDKMVNDEPLPMNEVKSKPNFRLRNLIENLEMANKEKLKLSAIDLKTYFATTTKLPPLELKPFQKSILRSNRPLELKNLLKLKDVELLPRHDFMKNVFAGKEKEPDNRSLELQTSLHIDNKNHKNGNCDDRDNNAAPSTNREVTTLNEPTSSEIIDAKTSSTNLYPDFDLENMDSRAIDNFNKNSNQIDLISSPLSNNEISISSNPINLKDLKSFDNENTESKEQLSSEELLGDNMSQLQDSINECLSQTLTNEENKKHDMTMKALNTEKEQKFDSSKYIQENFDQIELLEDLDLPIAFDNSSVLQETDLKQSDNCLNSNEILNDPITESNNNDLNVIKKNNIVSNSDFYDKLIQNSECIADTSNENLMQVVENVENENIMRQSGQQDDINLIQESQDMNTNNQDQSGVFPRSDPSIRDDNQRQITFQTLQNMSNSILKLSECATSDNIKGNVDTRSNDITDDIENKENSKEPVIKDELNLTIKSESKEISDQGSNKNLPKTTLRIDKTDNLENSKIDNVDKRSDAENNEMTAEASAPYCSSMPNINLELDHQRKPSLLRNTLDNLYSNIVTEPAVDLPKIFSNSKQSNILDNLKSKLENLFTTTERANNRAGINTVEDSVNESSNNKPIIAAFDNIKTSNKLQKPPFKLDDLTPKIPELSLKSFRNKIAVPKTLNHPTHFNPTMNSRLGLLELSTARTTIQKGIITEDMQHNKHEKLRSPLENVMNIDKLGTILADRVPNFSNSPLQLPRPFEDTFDPSSTLAAFSDSLKSHAENTLQNVKETLETNIKEPQFLGLFRQSDKTDSNNVLDVIARRDELNERLQAMQTDINDRLKLFHQSILDQLNLPSVRNYEFQDDNSNVGLKSSYPLRKESQFTETLKPRPNKPNSKSVPNLGDVSADSPTDKKILPSKVSMLSDLSQSRRFDELKTNLKENNPNKHRVLFENNKYPTIKQNLLPSFSSDDRKTTRIDLGSIRNKEALPIVRKSKISIVSDRNVPKSKSTLINSRNMGELSLEPGTSSSHIRSSKINILDEPSEDETLSSLKNSPTDSNVNKLRNSLLQRNHNIKPKNKLKVPMRHSPDSLVQKDSSITQKAILNHTREGRTRQGFNKNNNNVAKIDDDEFSSIIFNDATHSAAQKSERLKMVGPLRENIPYKCKLICYKDI